jgi:hypothetical protein
MSPLGAAVAIAILIVAAFVVRRIKRMYRREVLEDAIKDWSRGIDQQTFDHFPGDSTTSGRQRPQRPL